MLQRLHCLLKLFREFRVLLVLPRVSQCRKARLQSADPMLYILFETLQFLRKTPDLLRVNNGLLHASKMYGNAEKSTDCSGKRATLTQYATQFLFKPGGLDPIRLVPEAFHHRHRGNTGTTQTANGAHTHSFPPTGYVGVQP